MQYIKRLTQRNFLLLLGLDIFIVILSFYFSILFRFDFQISSDLMSLITLKNMSILVIVKIFSFRLFSLYRGMWRYTSVWDMFNIFKANVMSSLILTLWYSDGMKYSDFIHESEVNHKTLSYNLLTPKPAKGKSLRPGKISVSPAKAISLLAPYTITRIMEQIKAVVPLAAYLFLFQLLLIR